LENNPAPKNNPSPTARESPIPKTKLICSVLVAASVVFLWSFSANELARIACEKGNLIKKFI